MVLQQVIDALRSVYVLLQFILGEIFIARRIFQDMLRWANASVQSLYLARLLRVDRCHVSKHLVKRRCSERLAVKACKMDLGCMGRIRVVGMHPFDQVKQFLSIPEYDREELECVPRIALSCHDVSVNLMSSIPTIFNRK